MVRSMKRKAFTLIELLVVISIIALLLSILMPGLQKAKQHALRMICKTNLHNYGIAGNLYLAENDERFTDPWQSLYDSCNGRCRGACSVEGHQTLPGETQRMCRWHNAEFSLESVPEFQGPFWSYLESEEVNLCPIFKKVGKQRGSEHPLHVASIPIDPQFGYSQNAYLGYENKNPQWGVLKMSGVRAPARTFYFAEENMWLIPGLSSAVLNDNALYVDYYSMPDDCFGTFHKIKGHDYDTGVSNVVFVDGSVGEARPEEGLKLSRPRRS